MRHSVVLSDGLLATVCTVFVNQSVRVVLVCQVRQTFNSLTPKSAKGHNSRKIPNFILENIENQMVPCKSTAEEVLFERSHHRISLTDTKQD